MPVVGPNDEDRARVQRLFDRMRGPFEELQNMLMKIDLAKEKYGKVQSTAHYAFKKEELESSLKKSRRGLETMRWTVQELALRYDFAACRLLLLLRLQEQQAVRQMQEAERIKSLQAMVDEQNSRVMRIEALLSGPEQSFRPAQEPARKHDTSITAGEDANPQPSTSRT
ncbi:MAG: hypothetical protein M1820_007850 [Bogoriella megaspora]|nr:MAG: hypothetical protein M1820_007850 [Bogoriella megaspora]